MKSLLNSSNFASIEMDSARKIREAKEARWANLHFLNGVDGHLRETLATLYENEAKHLIYEATTSDNSGSFETVVFPLIRRVFSKLLANDIVSVQALDLPIGKIFFIKPVTSEREWEMSEGDLNKLVGKHNGLMGYQRTNRHFDGSDFDANDITKRSFESYARYGVPDEALDIVQTTANTTLPQVTQFMKKSLYDLFYDDFLFDNSKGKITLKVGKVDVVKMDAMGQYVPAIYDQDIPAIDLYLEDFANDGAKTPVEVVNTLLVQVQGFSSFNAGHLTGPDGNEMDTESFLASLKVVTNAEISNQVTSTNAGAVTVKNEFETAKFRIGEEIPMRIVTQRYGSAIVEGTNPNICDNDGKLYIELDLRKPVSRHGITTDGYIGVLKSALGFDGACAGVADAITALLTGNADATTRSALEALVRTNIATAKPAALEDGVSAETFDKLVAIILGEIWKNEYAKGVTETEPVAREAAITTAVKNVITVTTADIYKLACTSDKLADMFNIVWAQYDSLEYESEMGEVSFQLVSETISVEERKLRASWTPELAQDVMAFHNVDAEAELTAILSEQIAAEVDREILRDLRKGGAWTLRWDYNGWKKQGGFSTNYTQKDWNQTLVTNVNIISAQIQKATLRGGANFIIVSPEISAVLNDLEYFHVTDASAESEQYNLGIEKVGSLQGRYTVTVDPYAPAKSLLMGHHGSSLLDAGYVYCPYVPMALTPTLTNPYNFTPLKGIATRYAKKMLNNKFYGTILVDGLVRFATKELR